MPNQTPPPDINLVSYRLREIESNLDKHLEKLSDKIDSFLAELNKTTIAQSETKVKVDKLEMEVENLKKINHYIKEDVTNLRVSVAEKLTWGATGGGIAAVIIKIVENGGA